MGGFRNAETRRLAPNVPLYVGHGDENRHPITMRAERLGPAFEARGGCAARHGVYRVRRSSSRSSRKG